MRFVRPIFAAILFGLAPPVSAALVVLLADAAGFFYRGSFLPAFVFIVGGALVVGSPPMAMSGYAIAKAARAGFRPLQLMFVALTTGFVATGIAIYFWSAIGWLQPHVLLFLGVACLGALGALLVTPFGALAGRRFRPA